MSKSDLKYLVVWTLCTSVGLAAIFCQIMLVFVNPWFGLLLPLTIFVLGLCIYSVAKASYDYN